jgi:hypothetical protein
MRSSGQVLAVADLVERSLEKRVVEAAVVGLEERFWG